MHFTLTPPKRGFAILILTSVILTEWIVQAQAPLTLHNSLTSLTGQSLLDKNIQTRFQNAQNQIEIFTSLANSVQNFGLEVFSIVSYNYPQSDFMISPFAVWALWLILLEGSRGNTYNQIRSTLKIQTDKEYILEAFQVWRQHLNINTPTVEVASLQALYSSDRIPLQRDFTSTIKKYGGTVSSVNFEQPNTYNIINSAVEEATRGLIKTTVLPQDLIQANLFMFSSLYFKGQWTHPFNKSLTRYETFYDDNGTPLGKVPMMYQEGHFVYTSLVQGLNAYVVELPYGKEERLSMLIVYPKKGFNLTSITDQLTQVGIQPILARLDEASQYTETEVELTMPKFSTSSDMKLRSLLEYLGIRDAFSDSAADLSGIGGQLFVKDCIHTTKITVDEEGTTAAAVASAVLINKTSPTKFNINRPFIYLIVEKKTQLLLFAGHVANPLEST